MLRIDVAKRYLETQTAIFEGTIAPDMKEAMKLAVEAMEKQIPKKLIKYTEDDMEFIHYECPCCKDILRQHYKNARENMKSRDTRKYCGNCGQKLDWSDEND